MSYSSSKVSAQQSLTNSISYSPIINIGEDNSAEAKTDQRTSQEQSASQKDEVTASVGVGVGGDGSGGSVEKSGGDFQPMGSTTASDFFANDNTKIYLYAAAGLFVLVGGYMLLKKKKKRK